VIETVNSKVDLSKVINTGKFNMIEAESNSKWLKEGRYDTQPETEEYGISSFLFNQKRPFHPKRLHDLLNSSFLMQIVNPPEDGEEGGHHHHHHHHHHDDDEGEEGEEEGEEEDDEEAMKKELIEESKVYK
jgi:hypothetical protein